METARTEAESEPPVAAVEVQVDTHDSSPSSSASTSNPAAIASPATSTKSLKRTAEMMEEDEQHQDNKRKRLTEANEPDQPSTSSKTAAPDATDADKLVEEIGLELSCGCCAALCYNPVLVLPCQHYYCGSCYTLWTRQGGVNCPSCRSPVSSIIPSRAIQTLIETYLRSVPSRGRIPREKEQADEIYSAGQSIPVPAPRPRSPEVNPLTLDNDAYYRPCPHCPSPNDFNWSCPEPIIEPSVDINRARPLTDSIPPGHAKCGSCEHLHATRAPTTSRCDFCHQSFCGLVVPTRCHAKRIREAKPIGMDNLMDILGNSDVYDAFGINAVEFDYMLDYLREHDLSPRCVYSDTAEVILSTEDGWRPLLDRGLFPAVTEASGADPSSVPPTTVPDAAPSEPPAVNPQESAMGSVPASSDPVSTNTETQDQGMITEESNTIPVTEDVVVSPPATEQAAEPAGNEATTNTEMAVDPTPAPEHPAESTLRPPTPLLVPEREPTPEATIPEPTLDALPVEVEQRTEDAAPSVSDPVPVPVSSPVSPPPASDPQLVIVPSEDGRSSPSSRVSSPSREHEEPASSPPVPPETPRGPSLHKICRTCAAEVFFWGARNWWIKERAKAIENNELAEEVKKRKDCENLGHCEQEFDNSHAREFNHIPRPPNMPNVPPTTDATAAASNGNAEEPVSSEPTPPPPTDSETSTRNSSQTNVDERAPERPEQPSRAASLQPERMEVDPPAPVTARSPPPIVTDSNEIDRPASRETAVPDNNVPDLMIESPNVSQASGSSIDPPVDHISSAPMPVEYSEKMEPERIGDGDILMAIHDGSEAPIAHPVTTTSTA